jgi:uncharacterized protein (TIGR02145 family)
MSSDGDSHIAANVGNVGVGTSMPVEKLHVVGNILATGNINAGNNLVIYDETGNPHRAILKSDGTFSFEFICDGNIIDTRDGKYYNITKIGNQCWMAQNLNIGDKVTWSAGQQNNSVIEKFCYGEDESNCDTYGGLYQWEEAMSYSPDEGARGICPEGWHVPTHTEVKIMEGTVDSFYGVGDTEWDSYTWRGTDLGSKLKATSGWYSGGNGTDDYGFSALGGGKCEAPSGSYEQLTKNHIFWTSKEAGSNAVMRILSHSETLVFSGISSQSDALSLRCLKDFVCGDSIRDHRDWKTYGTVKIGDQCWMSQNLNIGIMLDISTDQTNNPDIEKYCYDDIEDNCDTLGGLYQWDEAMDYYTTPGHRGICPSGWHIPTYSEFHDLAVYLGGTDVAGGKMKTTGSIEASTGQWYNPNTGATNQSGFSGLPGGFSYPSAFDMRGYHAHFWTSDLSGPMNSMSGTLSYDLDDFGETIDMNMYGLSIRCIKDE